MQIPLLTYLKSHWVDLSLQAGHRVAIAATLLLAVVVYFALKLQPWDPVVVRTVEQTQTLTRLAWYTLLAADVVILLSGVMIVQAYRTTRLVRQTIGLLLFSLSLAHVAGYLLLSNFQSLDSLAKLLIANQIL